MRAYVGVTDADWIRRLGALGTGARDVNFWKPGGQTAFKALAPGEPFVFKTKRAHGNRLVGVGIFEGFAFTRVDEAWNLFGLGNGVSDLADFLRRLELLRRDRPVAPSSQIGSTLLRDVQFFDTSQQLPAPSDFQLNTVAGRTYNLDELPTQHEVFRAVGRYLSPTEESTELRWSWNRAMFSDPRLSRHRLGQEAFKAVIAQNFHHRCAITGDKVRPVLQAAHIRPVAEGGEHRSDNGLLLRSDVHTLFDAGYLGVDNRMRLQVSPALRSEFGNGDALYAKANETIALPARGVDQPNVEFLEWHMDVKFKR
jgi:putative restriction endonuclease